MTDNEKNGMFCSLSASFFLFSYAGSAETFEDVTEKQKQEFDWSQMEESVPGETEEFYGGIVSPDGLSGLLSPQKFFRGYGVR